MFSHQHVLCDHHVLLLQFPPSVFFLKVAIARSVRFPLHRWQVVLFLAKKYTRQFPNCQWFLQRRRAWKVLTTPPCTKSVRIWYKVVFTTSFHYFHNRFVFANTIHRSSHSHISHFHFELLFLNVCFLMYAWLSLPFHFLPRTKWPWLRQQRSLFCNLLFECWFAVLCFESLFVIAADFELLFLNCCFLMYHATNLNTRNKKANQEMEWHIWNGVVAVSFKVTKVLGRKWNGNESHA